MLLDGDRAVNIGRESIWIVHPDDIGFGARKPMEMAIRDVQRDWYKVLGAPPAVVISDEIGEKALPKDFKGTAIFIGKAAKSSAFPPITSDEGHRLFLHRPDSPSEGPTMIAAIGGNHIRGEIYALYAFSERVLGVDPTYFWTDSEPQFRGAQFSVDASLCTYDSGTPVWKYRGIFPNDEDLLGGLHPDPLGQSTFSSDIWDKILELLLRLKGNLMIPNTVTFPDESVFEIAKRRGVIASSQHFTLLGVNTWRWPEGIPYSFDQDSEIQKYVWSASIDTYEGRESVWTIGYRGLNDYPFWDDEPAFNTTEKRCALISEAMAAQSNLVRSTLGRENDECATYLWSEMLELYLSGHLKIPDGTTRVFADQGGSGAFDPRVVDQLQPGDGAYYHVQMESPGSQAQLTEMVPPMAFLKGMAPFVKKKATSLFMLNVSDLKPAIFMIDFIFSFLWNPEPFLGADPNHMQLKIITSWVQRFQDSKYVTEVSQIFNSYFTDIDYIAGVNGRLGEQHLAYFVRRLLTGEVTPSDAFDFLKEPYPVLKNLYARVDEVHTDMMKSVQTADDRQRLEFFESNIMLHFGIHWFACKSINSTASALMAINKTNPTPQEVKSAVNSLQDAIDALESLFEVERLAEHVKWRGLYGNDILDDFFLSACYLRLSLDGLLSKSTPDFTSSLCNLQSGYPWKGGTGKWSPWFIYQNTTANFPFLNRSPKWNMDKIVRITCVEPCENTPVGGTFQGEAKVELSIPMGGEVRYTTDGSDPNENSQKYSGLISVKDTTKICAVGLGNHEQVDEAIRDGSLITRSTFTLSSKS